MEDRLLEKVKVSREDAKRQMRLPVLAFAAVVMFLTTSAMSIIFPRDTATWAATFFVFALMLTSATWLSISRAVKDYSVELYSKALVVTQRGRRTAYLITELATAFMEDNPRVGAVVIQRSGDRIKLPQAPKLDQLISRLGEMLREGH